MASPSPSRGLAFLHGCSASSLYEGRVHESSFLLGRWLREVRRFSEKTQKEAGEILRLDRTQISRIESGTRQASIFEVLLLARFYEVPTPSLMKVMTEIQRSLESLKSPAELSSRSD